MRVNHEGDTHWFLYNVLSGQRLDATAKQFKTRPPYYKAVGCGFLTKQPSKKAAAMMETMVWSTEAT